MYLRETISQLINCSTSECIWFRVQLPSQFFSFRLNNWKLINYHCNLISILQWLKVTDPTILIKPHFIMKPSIIFIQNGFPIQNTNSNKTGIFPLIHSRRIYRTHVSFTFVGQSPTDMLLCVYSSKANSFQYKCAGIVHVYLWIACRPLQHQRKYSIQVFGGGALGFHSISFFGWNDSVAKRFERAMWCWIYRRIDFNY